MLMGIGRTVLVINSPLYYQYRSDIYSVLEHSYNCVRDDAVNGHTYPTFDKFVAGKYNWTLDDRYLDVDTVSKLNELSIEIDSYCVAFNVPEKRFVDFISEDEESELIYVALEYVNEL